MFVVFLVLSSLIVKISCFYCDENSKNITNQKLQEMIFANYDKNDMPFGQFEWNKPVHVDVEITVQGIPNIQQESAFFEVDLWFSQIWNDPSLQF